VVPHSVPAVPSSLHELLVDLLRSSPALVADLLALTDADLPAHDEAVLSAADLSDVLPAEYRADTVVVLRAAGVPVYAVVGEVQRGRDDDKPFTWPAYLAGARARWRCPAAVLVLCPDRAVAAWAARPIELDLLGSTVRPRVLGPSEIPVLLDAAEAAAKPELAVLSAVAHGADPTRRRVIDVAVGALADLDPDRRLTYLGTIFAGLAGTLARAHLEDLMNSTVANSELVQMLEARGRAEGEARGRAEGEARGRAESILAFLAARAVPMSAEARERVLACTDLADLDRWIRRAAVVANAEELFASA